MEEIDEILLSLKDKALEAMIKGDGDFYRSYLAESAIVVLPHGIFNKEAIVRQMSSGISSFCNSRTSDTRVFILNNETGVITYRATFEKSEGEEKSFYPFFVTVIYAKINGRWQGVFYQQTPI
jgi:hypothetical protein